jgi:hypothetical protein
VTTFATPSSPPTADRPRVPWLALIGPAFLALSTVFPWTTEAAAVVSGPVYATGVSVPWVSEFLMTRAPTLAQVLIVLAVVASGLILVQARWADILRRVLGACALILGGLFAWVLSWLSQVFESSGEATSWWRPELFDLGFYLSVIGAILLIVLPGARRSRPVAATFVAAEPGSGPAG